MMMFASESAIAQCAGDVTPPTAVCQDLDLYLDATGTAILTLAQLDGGSFDDCTDPILGGVSLSGLTQTIFTCADIGVNPGIGMTVTDAVGLTSTCTAIITVHDTIAPVAVCQNITVNLDGAGNATIVGSDLDGGSTDGCGAPALFTASKTSFTCADIGTNNVMLTVTDNNGNVDSCMAIVTIADTVVPTATCQPINAYLNAFGTVTISPSDIDNGSSDVCSSVTLAISASTFTCDSLGARTVYLYATDAAGNSDTCSSTVTVIDSTSPNVFGNNLTVYLDANGGIRIDSSDINTTSNDNCGISTIALSKDTFSCADAPIATVTMTVTDSSGNSSSADFNVFIVDTISPVAMCKDTTVYLDASGNVTIDTSYTNNGSSDNCSVILTLSKSSFTCTDTGAHTITMTATDGNGNTSTCTSTVTVLDTLAPVAVCKVAPVVFLDSTGNLVIDSSVINNGSSDNCSFTVTLSASTFTCADIGDTLISIYVTDASGNSDTCTTTLTISDNIAPIAICKDTTVYLDANGGFRIDSSYIENGSSDNCSIETITLSIDTFSCVDAAVNGIVNVTMTVTDSSGNASTCTATVTVLDTIAPVASCKDTTIYLNFAGQAFIDTSYTNNGSYDNCDFVLTLSNSSFTCADTGANTITMTATDAKGNTSTCTSTVTVLDTIAPVLTTKPATVYLDSMGNVTLVDSNVVLGIAEACLDTVIVTPRDFSCDSIGNRTVEVIAIDESGNADTASAVVTIVDNISPDAQCKDTTVYLDANGGFRIDSSYIENGSLDNCSIETITLSRDTFSCADANGTVTVTMTVTDSSGNSSTCTSTVTVEDTIAPVALCMDTTIYLDANGSFTINSTFVDSASTDNCTFTDSLSTYTFTCTDTGANLVTLYITDASGNVDSCTSTVTVIDNISPTAVCMDTTVYLTDSGVVLIDSSFVDGGSFDNCTYTASLSQSLFTCADAGPNTITIILTDASGNTSSCTATVTVLDSVSPVAICKDTSIYLDASRSAIIFPIDVNNGTYDNCYSANINTNATIFSCTDIGPNNVLLIATDPSGNVDSCYAVVTVLDSFGPTALCMDTTIYLDATGSFTIDSSFVDNGSNDDCSGVTDSLSQTTFTCADLGVNAITLYVTTDISGNIDSCVAMVTVLDTISPIVICQNVTAYLDASGNATIDSSDVDNGSYDNCSISTMTISQSSFDCSEVSTSIDTGAPTELITNGDFETGSLSGWTASALVSSGNPFNGNCAKDWEIYNSTNALSVVSCRSTGLPIVSGSSSLYTTFDGIGPLNYYIQQTISIPSVVTSANLSWLEDYDVIINGLNRIFTIDLYDASGSTFVQNIYTQIFSGTGRTDKGGWGTQTIDPTTILQSYLGQNLTLRVNAYVPEAFTGPAGFSIDDISLTVTSPTGGIGITLTATDSSGNTSSCSSMVFIVDSLVPTAICKNATIFLDSMGNASVGISDVNDGSFDNCAIDSMTLSKYDYTCADLGTNSVTLVVVDVNGNVDSCTGTVTVYDVLSPFITCKPDTLYLGATGVDTAIAMNLVDSVWDNCSYTVTASPTIFDCSKTGVNPVNVTVTDADGRTSSCYSNLTVLDTVSPTVACNSPTVYLNAIGLATITVGDIDNGSTDNCAISTMTISNNSFDCSNIGANPVTLTVTDASGNVSTCTSTVTVVDNTAPIAICQDITVYLDATGNVTIDSTDTDNGSTDNCTISTIALSQTAFDCTHVGIVNTVVVTVTDNSGNSSTCSSTVTVVDNVNPTANCKDATVYLDATGNVSITTADVNNTSTDNCAFTMSLSNSTFTCADAGDNTVTLYATDASGNLSLCTSTVTVLDTLNPIVICNSPTVYLNAIGLATITVGDIDNGSFDNCVIASMTISNNSFDCSNTGTNTVTLTLTDASGNTSVCSASVTVIDTNSPNTATISASLSTICLGASSTLTANSGSGYTYSWSNSLTIIGTSQSITVSPNSTTIYSVTLTSSSGCSSITTSDTIIVTPIVQATIIGPSAVCIGDSATLTANSGTSYLWSNGATTQSITVNPSSSTSYSVSVVNSGCSSNSSVSNVIVNPLPTVQAGNDQTICQGTAISLSANSGSGFAYSWSNSSIIGNTQSITVSPSSTSTYTVAVTDTNGCINSDQVTVNVTQLANPQIVGEDSVCQNSYNNLYSINSSNTNLVEWIVFNGDIQGLDGNSKNVLVNWYDNTLPAYIAVKETIAGSSCYKYDTLFIKFLNQSALDPTTINPLHPGSKILVASNSYPDMNWGYEAKNSGATIYVNGHNQYYEYSFIDTINFYYWVEVGDGNGCLTKSYYNSYVYYLNLEKRINTLNEINIYPNPVQDRIFIKGINNKISVKVFDQTGRLIDEYNMIKNEGNSIDVSNYSPGIYYLIFKTKKNIATHKFIKIP